MIRYIRCAAGALCITAFLACGEEPDPTAPVHDPAAEAAPPALSYSLAEPTEEELAEMPAEMRQQTWIHNEQTHVEFLPGAGVYATASMDYYATDAEQEVTLVLRKDEREVYRKTAKEAQEDFLARSRTMITNVAFSVNAACGHTADGGSAHRVWHKFIVGGWKYLSWFRNERPSGGNASQQPCEPPPPADGRGSSGGGGEGDYDTGCESCQQWFWVEYGEIVDEWWDCTPVDASLCEGLAE